MHTQDVKPKNNVQEVVLFVNHVGSGDWTHIARLGIKNLYLLSHFTGTVGTFMVLHTVHAQKRVDVKSSGQRILY